MIRVADARFKLWAELMGFTVYYQSIQPVAQRVRNEIEDFLRQTDSTRTWLSCEPVGFFGSAAEKHLIGGSKPNFEPHPDDIADAEAAGLPDGTLQDVVDILCQISSKFGIDWAFSHDHDEGPIGTIANGQSDLELQNQIIGLMSVGDLMSDRNSQIMVDDDLSLTSRQDNPSEDDDGEPMIFKFPGV